MEEKTLKLEFAKRNYKIEEPDQFMKEFMDVSKIWIEQVKVPIDQSESSSSASSSSDKDEPNYYIHNMVHFPVVFLYPVSGTSDFVQDFCEMSTFVDHLSTMFPNDASQPVVEWDPQGLFKEKNLKVYMPWSNPNKGGAIEEIWVDKTKTLFEALAHPKMVINGLPYFIVRAEEQ
eukprot:TRINITY_DN1344_c0_g1_i1.p1 TRINITY_DN1344_c0_g1~~TRINITY_DN1344_c0_g1_i1.p1  ORF type:complete len:175 (-),score=67.63 TRINITY_DN1344_c0_g1_i1:23-547(-)